MVLHLRNRWQFSFHRSSSLEFDGLFLSNGPGDPETQCPGTIATIKSWIQSKTIKPVFGICLGHQVNISHRLILSIIEELISS